MSSAPKHTKRRALDAYMTPAHVVHKCIAVLPQEPQSAWEPHAGGGAWVRALQGRGWAVRASDIDPAAGWTEHDALDGWSAAWHFRPQWVIGNPPFNGATDHIEAAWDACTVGVAFLLRLALLESKRRAEWWERYPPSQVWVLSERPSFTGNGKTDSAAYAFFVWRRDHVGAPTLGWL